MLSLLASAATARPASRPHFNVDTRFGPVLVESFENGFGAPHRAVIILSGSRGFRSSAYDSIGRTFQAAGLNVYLVHVLTPADLSSIANAGTASARMAYYARRFPAWRAEVRDVVAYFRDRQHLAGKVGLLGISLGAETAALAAIGNHDVSALVLVDGVPETSAGPVRFLPPLHLIWGSDDTVFSLSSAQALSRKAHELGGSADLAIFKGGRHNFFLKPASPPASDAYANAIAFFTSRLSRQLSRNL